jgi:hypothetical protein
MYFLLQGGRSMIMTQEQGFLKAHEQLQALIALVNQASTEQHRIDQVERSLFSQLLQLGLTLLNAFVAAAGDGDVGATVATPEGTVQQRLPQPHSRCYRSIFGTLDIPRFVYGSREGQQIESVPLDARLGLPAGEFSYVLEDWLQRFCIKGAFGEAAQSLEDLLGLRPSVRSLEHMNRTMAEFAATFADQRPLPAADEEGELVVLSADGKGVVMRRPALAEPHRRARGSGPEKTGKKQMACVGACYTIDRFVRTPAQVIDELQRRERAPARPQPCHKHVWAEMTCVVEGETLNGRTTLFDHLAEEWAQRDPNESKPAICLLDGERALWEARDIFFPNTVGILDLFHVLERLWDAAHCFHAEGSSAAATFVTEHLRLLLEGKVGYVIGGLRQMQTKQGLTGAKKKTLAKVIGYYENNREHMRYDEYLAGGYPIGSGVAEGACRHLVKDRLEQTGMRWVREGAQAMLYLRATYLNGDWEAFLAYRIQTEQRRLYGSQAQEPQFAMSA